MNQAKKIISTLARLAASTAATTGAKASMTIAEGFTNIAGRLTDYGVEVLAGRPDLGASRETAPGPDPAATKFSGGDFVRLNLRAMHKSPSPFDFSHEIRHAMPSFPFAHPHEQRHGHNAVRDSEELLKHATLLRAASAAMNTMHGLDGTITGHTPPATKIDTEKTPDSNPGGDPFSSKPERSALHDIDRVIREFPTKPIAHVHGETVVMKMLRDMIDPPTDGGASHVPTASTIEQLQELLGAKPKQEQPSSQKAPEQDDPFAPFKPTREYKVEDYHLKTTPTPPPGLADIKPATRREDGSMNPFDTDRPGPLGPITSARLRYDGQRQRECWVDKPGLETLTLRQLATPHHHYPVMEVTDGIVRPARPSIAKPLAPSFIGAAKRMDELQKRADRLEKKLRRKQNRPAYKLPRYGMKKD